MNWLGKLVQMRVGQEDSMLDLGCGIMQGTDDIRAKFILGVDVWPKYLNKIKHLHPTVQLKMDELWRFMDDSFDVVICLDVVEHLEESLALNVIDECKRIARKTAIVYTPSEFKDNMESTKNAWGLGECPYQEHKCLLGMADFVKRGYNVELVTDDGLFAEWNNGDIA